MVCISKPHSQLLSPQDVSAHQTYGVMRKEMSHLQERQSGMQEQSGKLIADLQGALGDIRAQQQQLCEITQLHNDGLKNVDHRQSVLGDDVRDIRRVQRKQNESLDSQRRHSDSMQQYVIEERQMQQQQSEQAQSSTMQAVERSHGIITDGLKEELIQSRNITNSLQERLSNLESAQASNTLVDLSRVDSQHNAIVQPTTFDSNADIDLFASVVQPTTSFGVGIGSAPSTFAQPTTGISGVVNDLFSSSMQPNGNNGATGSVPMSRPIVPMPNVIEGQSTSHQVTTVHAATKKPPKFSIERYTAWKDEIELWRETRRHVGECALISEIALSAEDVFRTVMLRYVKNTRGETALRNFKSLFKVLDTGFLRDSHERSMIKMHLFQSFVRRSNETIVSFWIRSGEMIADLEACGISFDPSIVYLRAYQALQLTENQRYAVIAAMSSSANSHCPTTLRVITNRLLNTPLKADDTYNQRTASHDNYKYTHNDKQRQRQKHKKFKKKCVTIGCVFVNRMKCSLKSTC